MKEHFEKARVDKEREVLGLDMSRAKEQLGDASRAVAMHEAEISKLNHIIREADQVRCPGDSRLAGHEQQRGACIGAWKCLQASELALSDVPCQALEEILQHESAFCIWQGTCSWLL